MAESRHAGNSGNFAEDREKAERAPAISADQKDAHPPSLMKGDYHE